MIMGHVTWCLFRLKELLLKAYYKISTRRALNLQKNIICHNYNPYKYTNYTIKGSAERGLVFSKYSCCCCCCFILFYFIWHAITTGILLHLILQNDDKTYGENCKRGSSLILLGDLYHFCWHFSKNSKKLSFYRSF